MAPEDSPVIDVRIPAAVNVALEAAAKTRLELGYDRRRPPGSVYSDTLEMALAQPETIELLEKVLEGIGQRAALLEAQRLRDRAEELTVQAQVLQEKADELAAGEEGE